MKNQIENSFDTPKASHFTASEILELFVDAQGESETLVAGLLRPTSTTPQHLLGGKGSGKPHLLRFCSIQVRHQKHSESVASAIRNDQYLGLYIASEALNAQKFTGKNLTSEKW